MDQPTPSSPDLRNLGRPLLIVAWLLFTISLVIVGLRFFTKLYYVQRRVLADDVFMGAALISQFINNILITLGVQWGFGKHLDLLDATQKRHALKWILLQEPFAVSSSAFGRAGFAIFLLHLIGPAERGQRLVLKAIVVIQILLDIVVVTQLLAQCGSHISAQWDPAVAATAHCQSPEVETLIGYIQSAINSLTDICLTVIPLLLIKPLQMDRRTKLGLAGLLGLSAFAFSASIVKAVNIRNLSGRNNFTWTIALLTLCVVTENNLVMIGASIPTLRPLLTRGKRGASSYDRNQQTSTVGGTSGKTGSKMDAMHLSRMRTASRAMDDNISEEGLWSGDQDKSGGTIVRTMDVSVTYVDSKEPEEPAGTAL